MIKEEQEHDHHHDHVHIGSNEVIDILIKETNVGFPIFY